jgi:hypothetical protein
VQISFALVGPALVRRAPIGRVLAGLLLIGAQGGLLLSQITRRYVKLLSVISNSRASKGLSERDSVLKAYADARFSFVVPVVGKYADVRDAARLAMAVSGN